MSIEDRIWFEGNPWPEGHAVEEFAWTARVVDGVVWFDLHLETVDYDAEREIEEDEDADHESSWEAPVVWNNFHSCTISSTEWHEGGFPVCAVEDYSVESLDGYEARVDPLPVDVENWEELAFHTYLLGHDSVAGHVIRFVRREGGGDRYDIEWEGKAALTYVGDDEFRYDFKVRIYDVAAPVPVVE